MREKGLPVAAAAATLALFMAALPFTGCDHAVAGGELHGRWLAWGGTIVEFTGGRFTRTMPGGTVQYGTFETHGDLVTFHRRGYTPETLPFTLEFPRLTLGETIFFHDSPGAPNDLEGVWQGFMGAHGTAWPGILILGPAEPQRGNRWVMEGVFQQMTFRGAYTVSARNIPDTGVFTMRATHVAGASVFNFVQMQLPVHLMYLFDWDRLQISGIPPGEWWFTLDEARSLFVDAAGRTGGDLALERQVIDAMNRFLPAWVGETEFYDYTLEKVDGDIYDLTGAVVDGNLLLTIRTETGGILTFARMELE